MNSQAFRDLVSRKKRGLVAECCRAGLQVLEAPYACAMFLRNQCYDWHIFSVECLPIPIVSVGNLTVGGTGKSPLVAWLGRYFLEQGLMPGVISRGYGKQKNGVNDEFLELAWRLPNVPHRQNRDRVAAAQAFLDSRAVSENRTVDLLILDDAFQHRRIARNLDIVLLDATAPFGCDHLLPRGLLRESLSGLRRAQIALLSRADQISPEERAAIQQRVQRIAPQIQWGEVIHRPDSLLNGRREPRDLSELAGKRVFAFCGIGNPEAFRRTLETAGATVVGFSSFPDHYRFTKDDVSRLESEADRAKADFPLCTVKDFVKIEPFVDQPDHFFALSISLRFLSGEQHFRSLLSQRLRT